MHSQLNVRLFAYFTVRLNLHILNNLGRLVQLLQYIIESSNIFCLITDGVH